MLHDVASNWKTPFPSQRILVAIGTRPEAIKLLGRIIPARRMLTEQPAVAELARLRQESARLTADSAREGQIVDDASRALTRLEAETTEERLDL